MSGGSGLEWVDLKGPIIKPEAKDLPCAWSLRYQEGSDLPHRVPWMSPPPNFNLPFRAPRASSPIGVFSAITLIMNTVGGGGHSKVEMETICY